MTALARRNLYKDIPFDLNLMADPVLDSFYVAEQSGTYSKLEQFSRWMADTNYTQAEIVNNSIVTVTNTEENYKLFQAIILKLAKGFAVDENDYLTLDYVARQCPISGGEVVYQARSFLNLLNLVDLDEDHLQNETFTRVRQTIPSAMRYQRV